VFLNKSENNVRLSDRRCLTAVYCLPDKVSENKFLVNQIAFYVTMLADNLVESEEET